MGRAAERKHGSYEAAKEATYKEVLKWREKTRSTGAQQIRVSERATDPSE